MVGTIPPIWYGESAERKLVLSPWLHGLGNVLGAGSLGWLLGAVGSLAPWHGHARTASLLPLLATGLAGVAYSLREIGIIPVPAPQLKRQVPSQWRYKFPPRVVALIYGVELGFGLTTRIPVSTFYVVALWATVVSNPPLSAFVLGLFGLGRILPILLCGGRRWSISETSRMLSPLLAWQPAVRQANGLVLAIVGSSFAMAALAMR